MKKTVRLYLDKAVASLIIGVEHFNRPSDLGRVSSVLILFDHAFEMLLKAAILHRGGRIREKRETHNIGFDACVRRAFSDGAIKFLTEENVLTLQMLNGLRDAAQHDLLEVSEAQMYMQAQAGLTLFRDLTKQVFAHELENQLPSRVLPLSTTPPLDLVGLFDAEVNEVRKLLAPKNRRKTEAAARLKALAILDGTVQGETSQPSEADLRRLMANVAKATSWTELFPGVAQLNLTSSGVGPTLDLRLSKKDGIPVQLVPEGTGNATVVAVKRVDELGFYNLGRKQLAHHVGLTPPQVTAVVRYLKLQDDVACFRRWTIQGVVHEQYSQAAIPKIKEAVAATPISEIWKTHGVVRRRRTAA